jgi:hypothetical protein
MIEINAPKVSTFLFRVPSSHLKNMTMDGECYSGMFQSITSNAYAVAI